MVAHIAANISEVFPLTKFKDIVVNISINEDVSHVSQPYQQISIPLKVKKVVPIEGK